MQKILCQALFLYREEFGVSVFTELLEVQELRVI